mgnify:CR=1 FL=1
MNESIKNLLERRSIRAYKKELVPKETLDTILEAGEYSPSGMGQQSTLMVVTQDPELVARLSKMNAAVMGSTSDPFYGAPTVIIVFFRQQNGHLCGKRKSCDGKSHECRTCSRRGLLLDSPCKRSF